jgi:hypothetical protein
MTLSGSPVLISCSFSTHTSQTSQTHADAWKEAHDRFKRLDDANMREYSEEVDTVLVFVRIPNDRSLAIQRTANIHCAGWSVLSHPHRIYH